jgi:hypothetical protein
LSAKLTVPLTHKRWPGGTRSTPPRSSVGET